MSLAWRQRTAGGLLQSRDRTHALPDYEGRLTELDLHPFRRCFCYLGARDGGLAKDVLYTLCAPLEASQPPDHRAGRQRVQAPTADSGATAANTCRKP